MSAHRRCRNGIAPNIVDSPSASSSPRNIRNCSWSSRTSPAPSPCGRRTRPHPACHLRNTIIVIMILSSSWSDPYRGQCGVLQWPDHCYHADTGPHSRCCLQVWGQPWCQASPWPPSSRSRPPCCRGQSGLTGHWKSMESHYNCSAFRLLMMLHDTWRVAKIRISVTWENIPSPPTLIMPS